MSAPCARPAGHQAGHDRHAVEEHGAGPALTFGAALLGTGQAGLVPEPVEQRPGPGRGLERASR